MHTQKYPLKNGDNFDIISSNKIGHSSSEKGQVYIKKGGGGLEIKTMTDVFLSEKSAFNDIIRLF